MATAKNKHEKPTSYNAQDATALLKTDHELVCDLFAEYEEANSTKEKKQIAEQICNELTVHAQIEADAHAVLFY
jgi:hypothetical protein